jgi:general stress protein 26
MAEELQDYEKVSIYPLDADLQEQLLSAQRECVFNWSTREGWPMGVIMSCLWRDGRMWLTSAAHRHRISAVRRDPRVSVVVTSTGTPLGPGKTVTIKGRCIVHEDRETKDWFYPEFSAQLYPNPEHADPFCKRLDSPLRVVLEIVPEKYITYDGVKMFAHSAGRIDESQLGPAKSSDTERLERELVRRGMS